MKTRLVISHKQLLSLDDTAEIIKGSEKNDSQKFRDLQKTIFVMQHKIVRMR